MKKSIIKIYLLKPNELDNWTTIQILMRIQSLTEYLKTHSFLLQMQSISTENKPKKKQRKRKALFQQILINVQKAMPKYYQT